MAKELGQEVRVRLAYAILGGAFGMLTLIAIGIQSVFGTIILGVICIGLLWIATSTKWGNGSARRPLKP